MNIACGFSAFICCLNIVFSSRRSITFTWGRGDCILFLCKSVFFSMLRALFIRVLFSIHLIILVREMK